MTTENAESERLIKPEELAAQFDVTRATLRRWEAEGVGPPCVRIGAGKLRRYRASAVRDYIAGLESESAGGA